MTENRRIVLNIAATYGRSLFAMACGIFCGRWALMALGEVDYGLHGLVGGLTVFIGFLNGVLGAAVGRFYALSIGRARTDAAAGLEEARRWFSIALVIHTVVPALLLVAGWPVGEWAIRRYLTIPEARIPACLWVFRCSCAGCLVGMVSVPFNAFYGAKQYIAELTVYGFATTALNVFVLHYMVTHPGDWLVRYALWLTALGILPSLIITFRALRLFPECRFRLAYCADWPRFRQLFTYAFWQFFGSLSALLKSQGIAVLANRNFGPSFNAALSVANNVNGKANELGGSLLAAFTPAITSAYGQGDLRRTHALTLRVCKFGVLASLVFVLPLALELDYVLRLWLVNPPEFVTPLCHAVMAQVVVNRMTKGHLVLVQAVGRMALYETVVVGLALTILPVAWLLIRLGLGRYSICIAFVTVTTAYSWVRPFFTERMTGLSAAAWWRGVCLPVVLISALALGLGFGVRASLPEGIVRLALTTLASELALLPLAWRCLFDGEERAVVRGKLAQRFARGGAR